MGQKGPRNLEADKLNGQTELSPSPGRQTGPAWEAEKEGARYLAMEKVGHLHFITTTARLR